MAGDWIKIEENMTEKPEVLQMAASLVIDPDAVAGKLIRIWVWASRNCNGDGVTNVTVIPLLNRIAGVTGFTDAMLSVGWLAIDGDNLVFPNFDRHCSKTAKERANTNRRVAKLRECNAQTVTNVTPAPLQKPLPEKRREENIQTTTEPPVVVDDEDDDFKSSMPSEIAKRMGDLLRRINSLHPSWKKRPHFSAKELQSLHANTKGWLAVTDDDWRLLAAYMDAAIPDGWKKHPNDYFQPDNRLALINMGHTSILGIADKWLRECKKHGVITGLEGGYNP